MTSKGQRVDQGTWKLRKGYAGAVGQFDDETVAFYDDRHVQVRYLPNGKLSHRGAHKVSCPDEAKCRPINVAVTLTTVRVSSVFASVNGFDAGVYSALPLSMD